MLFLPTPTSRRSGAAAEAADQLVVVAGPVAAAGAAAAVGQAPGSEHERGPERGPDPELEPGLEPGRALGPGLAQRGRGASFASVVAGAGA